MQQDRQPPQPSRTGPTYATIMVHVQAGIANVGLLSTAAHLAEHFGSRVVGIATSQPMRLELGTGYVPFELIEQDRQDLEGELQAAEAEFRGALQGRVDVTDWRSCLSYAPCADYVAQQARCADLIVLGAGSEPQRNGARRLDVGALLMQAGRPILLVPPELDRLRPETVVIGWRDTLEARRAVAAALPFLMRASQVILIEIAPKNDLAVAQARLADVATWLAAHGVEAGCVVEATAGNDAARLAEFAQTADADLFVAGAYGHSRMREWAFGGVTRDLLLNPDRCSLLSH